jgi:biotin carboxylase
LARLLTSPLRPLLPCPSEKRRGVGVNKYLTELAALACAELGLPGNDSARAHTARDKAAMVQTLAAAGVRTPYTRIARDTGELQAALDDARVGFPCVIKPVAGAGSSGVTVADSPADAVAAAEAARRAGRPYDGEGDARILVQAYATGTEYSVDSVTQDGVTTHLAVTRKLVTGGARRVETGHSLPACLPAPVEAAVH